MKSLMYSLRNPSIDTGIFAFLMLCMLGALYGKAAGLIGFLSDDWSLIHRAALAPFWIPAEQHHYSIFVNLLFKGVSQGYLDAFYIHLMAFVFHALNCFIIYFFARDVLSCKPVESKLIAFLFAVSPAGLEAITWCCAIGYVLCTFWILLAIVSFWKVGTHMVSFSHACLLAGLQLGAFLCWDWGLLLAPSLVSQCFVSLKASEQNSSFKRVKTLWPVISVWILLVALKRMVGQDFGYAINTPWQMVVNFFTVPLLSVLPQFTKAFYVSFIGVGIALACFLMVLWTAWRNAIGRAMWMLLLIWQLPLILLGYPQSRYFYLLALPVYVIGMQFLKEVISLYQPSIKKLLVAMSYVLVLGMIGLYFLWSSERILWWQNAFAQSQSIYDQIEKAAEQELKPLAVVNMPDRYGPEGVIWLPYLWRCGLVHFKNEFVQVYTSDCLHPPADMTPVSKEKLAELYAQYSLYEVQQTDDREALLLVKSQLTLN